MSDTVRRLLSLAPGFNTARVPEGFQENIGTSFQVTGGVPPAPPDMSPAEAAVLGRGRGKQIERTKGAEQPLVEAQAGRLAARFELAQEKADEIAAGLAKQKKGGGGVNMSEQAIAQPFSDLIELVRTYGKEAEAGPTVVADMAHALMSLKPEVRDMVIRRAGNPQAFDSLRGADLPKPDEDAGTSLNRAVEQKASRAAVRAEDKRLATANNVDTKPQIKRPSSVMALPDSMSARGKITPSSKQYKKFLPKGKSPMEVVGPDEQVARIKEMGFGDDEIASMSQADKNSLVKQSAKSAQTRAVKRLAGDQLRERRAIQNNLLKQRGYTDEDIAKLPQKKRDEIFPPDQISDAELPNVVGPRGKAAEDAEIARTSESGVRTTLRTGTDTNYWRARDRKRGTPNVDTEVGSRNMGESDRVTEMLYKLTDPESGLDYTTTTLDLDKYAPWWRGRYAAMDEKGGLTDPDRLPSAEFVTGMLEGLHGIQDERFFERTLPLIQRSIAAASEVPDQKMYPRAYAMSQKVFLPSKQFEETMQQGVGSADFPYPIYGDRQVPRDAVTAPERNPFQNVQEADQQEVDSALDEFRKFMGQQPGLNDQSSINRLPAQSPVRFLLA